MTLKTMECFTGSNTVEWLYVSFGAHFSIQIIFFTIASIPHVFNYYTFLLYLERVSPSTLLFFFKKKYPFAFPCKFYMLVNFHTHRKKPSEILVEIALNPLVNLGKKNIFTMVDFPVHTHIKSLHLLRSYFFSNTFHNFSM